MKAVFRSLVIGSFMVGGLPAVGFAQSSDLPEGAGRTEVESLCTACHSTRNIVRSAGYPQDHWRELIDTMVDLRDEGQLARVTDYLASHFPADAGRTAIAVPGDLEVRFHEWRVPTRGQRARDPHAAPDGSIWWAGQWANLVGRIDRKTGEMREYLLPPNAMPHTVTVASDGMVWYTGNKNASIGRLDPSSGVVTEFPMPDPAARDPHTAVFDASGNLWFTAQHANMAGRLVPSTGEIRLIAIPRSGARPYGIVIDDDGVPWIACNGSNCLVSIDPETLVPAVHELPDPQTTVRRLDTAPDGALWYVNSRLGRLGRFDPATGSAREWPSPSGGKSHPYALAVVDGIVWYNESGVRPDMLVRFDPSTEKFQSWAIPSGTLHAGIVRHMRATPAGTLLIHQSSTNRIIEVTLP